MLVENHPVNAISVDVKSRDFNTHKRFLNSNTGLLHYRQVRYLYWFIHTAREI
jgi:hypothetical protein